MKSIAAALITLCLALLASCSSDPEPATAAAESVRQIADGKLVGFADRFDTYTWRSIPYAAPPVGDLRWRAPRPVPAWEGTREALEWPNWCPQFPIPMVTDTDESWLGDEDCLYLNVSAPRSWQDGDEPLPVMVWIHGGGNALGSTDLYSSVRNLATKENVVIVSIQYRLGMLGWFNHPSMRELADNPLDASGNFGTLDTIAALEWVRDNITVFGGDPGNVTIFGESAGGINVFALLLSPLAEGLFHRAISQSGIVMTAPMASADGTDLTDINPNSSAALLSRLLVADGKAVDSQAADKVVASWNAQQTMDYLRGKSAEELLMQTRGQFMGMYPVAQLLRDGTVLPDMEPLDAFAQGRFNKVPIIAGTNRDEIKTMMMRDPVFTQPLFGVLPRIKDKPLYNQVTSYGSDMWKVVGADEPAAAILASGHKDIWVYRFDWDELSGNFLMDFETLLGAGHGMEIPFVFYDLDGEMSFLPFAVIDDKNRETAAPLSASMSAYWGKFAHAGEPARGDGELPAWSAWTPEGAFLVFDVATEGGIRMEKGTLERDAVFQRLASDSSTLGSSERMCQAWEAVFGPEAIFGFAALCADGETCSGSKTNFCVTE